MRHCSVHRQKAKEPVNLLLLTLIMKTYSSWTHCLTEQLLKNAQSDPFIQIFWINHRRSFVFRQIILSFLAFFVSPFLWWKYFTAYAESFHKLRYSQDLNALPKCHKYFKMKFFSFFIWSLYYFNISMSLSSSFIQTFYICKTLGVQRKETMTILIKLCKGGDWVLQILQACSHFTQ